MSVDEQYVRDALHRFVETPAPAPRYDAASAARRGDTIRRRRWIIGGTAAALAALVSLGLHAVIDRGNASPPPAGPSVRGTMAVLHPVTVDGTPPTSAELDRAAQVLTLRFTGDGLPAPTITVTPSGDLALRIPAAVTADTIASLTGPGLLTIRAVLDQAGDDTASSPAPADTAPPNAAPPTLAQVKAAVGTEAWNTAAALTAPPHDQATIAKLQPFAELRPDQVAVLPAETQFNVPTINCAQLDARDPLGLTDAAHQDQRVTACDAGQPVKYLLDVAKVTSADLATVTAAEDPTNYGATGGWYVSLSFTAAGQPKWSSFTAAEVNSQVALMVDGSVLSAPTIQSAINGPAIISGPTITGPFAHRLAGLLGAGALPVEFTVTDVTATG